MNQQTETRAADLSGPAFPTTIHERDYPDWTMRGMTRRDFFAAFALQGLMASHAGIEGRFPKPETFAKDAAEQADALLAELDGTPDPKAMHEDLKRLADLKLPGEISDDDFDLTCADVLQATIQNARQTLNRKPQKSSDPDELALRITNKIMDLLCTRQPDQVDTVLRAVKEVLSR